MTLTLKTSGAVNSAITKIKTQGVKLDTLIHETEVQCMLHAQQHGDVTLLAKLCNAMPQGSRVRSLLKHIADHVPVQHTQDKVTKEHKFKIVKSKNLPANWKIEAANAVPFWEYSLEAAPTMLTFGKLEAQIKALITRSRKAIAEGRVDTENVVSLQAYITKLEQSVSPIAEESAA